MCTKGRGQGFALLELLVAIFVLGILSVTLFSLATLGTKQSLLAEQRTVAQALLTEQSELLRTYAYDDVGYTNASGNEPAGTLARIEAITRNNQLYQLNRTITLIDDPTNGLVSGTLTESNADYKEVQLTVQLPNSASSQSVQTAVIVSPVQALAQANPTITPTPTPTPTPPPAPTPTATPPPPTVNLTDNSGNEGPFNLNFDTPLLIRWTSTDAASCLASANPSHTSWRTSKALNGSQSMGNQTASRTYTLRCTGLDGTQVTDNLVVNLNPPPPSTVTLYANGANVSTYHYVIAGPQTIDVSWSTTYATSCSVYCTGTQPNVCSVTSSNPATGRGGSIPIQIYDNEFAIVVATCDGPSGTSNDSISIRQ